MELDRCFREAITLRDAELSTHGSLIFSAVIENGERIDDIPLLFSQLQRLKLAKVLLDECFPTHGNWRGLSLGEVLNVWLVFILSEANHRMSYVEP